ncbi:MAG: glycerophosphodiester phosphodiesterase family protein [Rhodoluna sp.]
MALSLGERASFAGMQKPRAIYPYLSPALPRIFAHRGLAIEPGVFENTIPAFRAALLAGATHLETDVQVTKDEIPVLFHDDDLNRVIGLPRKVSELTFAELSAAAQHAMVEIPTLRRALTELPETRFNLDLKVAAAIAPTAALINELDAAGRILVTSFSESRRARTVMAIDESVASSAGGLRVLALRLAAACRLKFAIVILARPIQAIQIPVRQGPIRFDSPSFIRQMTAAGLELHYWTINDAAEMRRLIALGAHGIVTDRTDIAVNTL